MKKKRIIFASLGTLVVIITWALVYSFTDKTYSNKYFSIKIPSGYKIIQFDDYTWFIKNSKDKSFLKTISINPMGDSTREKIIGQINEENKNFKAQMDISFKYKTFKKEKVDWFKIEPFKIYDHIIVSYILSKGKNAMNINISYNENSEFKHEKIFFAAENIKFKDFTIAKPIKTITKQTLTQSEVLEDLNELTTKLEIHPDLYHSTEKKDFEKNIKLLKKEITLKPEFDRREVSYIFAKLINRVEDMHTSFIPSEFLEFSLFPLRVNIRNNKIFITNKNFSNKPLMGKEILSINNVNSQDILKKLMEITNMDNNHISGREYYLSKNFFMDYFLVYGVSDNYFIKTKDENGKIEDVNLKGISTYNISEPIKDQSTFMVNKVDGDSVVLNFNNFATQDIFTFKRKTLEFFKMLEEEKVKNLVIDDRENCGGNLNYVIYFYDYLNEKSSNYSFKNNVYLLSGRSSFSAGEEALAYCKKINSKTTIVGEPTSGGLPFGNPISFQLKNSKNFIVIASASFSARTKGIVTPDVIVNIVPRLEAMGIDQVMDKVKELIKAKSKI